MLMYKMILQTLLLALTLFSHGTANSKSACGSEQMAVTKIINSLGFRLEQMTENQGNYFFSPLSISVALAMVYVGARGKTREQMSVALEYNIVGKNCLPNKISESFRDLIRSLQKDGDDYSFLIANGAFIQTNLQISHFYSSNLEKFFNSSIKYMNFAEEEQETMKKVNEWVAESTRGKISKLLNEPLDAMTVMVLLNAVYFKGLWDLPFNEDVTRDGLFYRINDTAKTVRFMIMQDKAYHYYDAEKKHFVLELEYLGGNISMILILPKETHDFPNYVLTNELLCEMRRRLEYKTITILMPKFSMDFKRELSKDMINLGMGELFTDRADLTGIRESKDLHVSLIMHKAVIEVNEKGSEAAAIVGIGIDGRNKGSREEVFFANHPFMFYIIHRETNTILFSGRLVDP